MSLNKKIFLIIISSFSLWGYVIYFTEHFSLRNLIPFWYAQYIGLFLALFVSTVSFSLPRKLLKIVSFIFFFFGTYVLFLYICRLIALIFSSDYFISISH